MGEVVASFRAALPAVTIYVYDNNSADDTAGVGLSAGAIVCREKNQGKGHVVRRKFAEIYADVYVLVGSDATYDAPSAPTMVARLLNEKHDMVVGVRA